MAVVHSKNVVVSVGGTSLSGYSNSITFSRTADSHDVTTFGQSAKVYVSGLTDGTASIEGFYDTTAMTSPGAVFKPLLGGAAVELVYRPEGTGSSKPESDVDVIVTSYEESSAVADIVMFSVELQFTGAVDDTAQPA